MELEVKCNNCFWQGDILELCCSKEDFESNKLSSECKFNLCPECGSIDITDINK